MINIEENYYNYYFKLIDGDLIEGERVTLELIDNPGVQIERVVRDEKTNGLYVIYKGVRYYESYHIKIF